MKKFLAKLNQLFLMLVAVIMLAFQGQGQNDEAIFTDSKSKLWINTYGNISLKGNFFWDLQTHFRFQEKNSTPLVGQWAQLYNRHGIGYIFSKNFNATAGFVFRLNNNIDDVEEDEQSSVSEWRIWHQYQFAMPFSRFNVYHRLRIEHRWSKGFTDNSEYIYRNRYRYMFNVKIPLNKPRLEEKVLYISPEVEVIMQSGKTVINSPLEDLRLHTSVGYILNYQLILAAGFMYTLGQELPDGAVYKQGTVMRLHVYYFLDTKKWKKQNLPFNLMN